MAIFKTKTKHQDLQICGSVSGNSKETVRLLKPKHNANSRIMLQSALFDKEDWLENPSSESWAQKSNGSLATAKHLKIIQASIRLLVFDQSSTVCQHHTLQRQIPFHLSMTITKKRLIQAP